MTDEQSVTRPIAGIKNRTAQEVFDIMCDRFRLASQADQGAEIARLKLDIAAQECLQDSAYKAGLAAGWNFAQDDDNDGFQRARSSTAHIAELKRIRAARQALTSQANGLDPLADLGGPLQSRRDFVEHWRGVVADHGGHTMVANANTVRRLVHIIDALATHPAPAEPVELREAAEGIDDDYMTSEKHHPGYVLIPTAKFEKIVAATKRARRIVPPYYVNWHHDAEIALATHPHPSQKGEGDE